VRILINDHNASYHWHYHAKDNAPEQNYLRTLREIITTFKVDKVKHTDEMIRQVDEIVLSSGKCRVGDEVVIVAGSPPGIPGSTNSLRVHRVGDAVHLAAPGYGN
jgi:pyruvate kinase